jgi:hypothetical protein
MGSAQGRTKLPCRASRSQVQHGMETRPCLDTSCILLHHVASPCTKRSTASSHNPLTNGMYGSYHSTPDTPTQSPSTTDRSFTPLPSCFIPICAATANPTRHPQGSSISSVAIRPSSHLKSLWRQPNTPIFQNAVSGSLADSICPFEVHGHGLCLPSGSSWSYPLA